MLASGLDGIERKLTPPDAMEENVYEFSSSDLDRHDIAMLPENLKVALAELRADDVVLGTLGDHIGPWFLRAKDQEWQEFSMHVTDWEHRRYLYSL